MEITSRSQRLLVVVVALLVSSCGRTQVDMPDPASTAGSVTGMVTEGGSPLGDAMITFTPEGNPDRAQTITSAQDGMYLFDATDVGKHTVTVDGSDTKLSVDVTTSEQEFDIEL